jgi:hypothetical protein
VFGVTLLLVALPGLFVYYGNVQRQDFRTAALWLERHYRAGDGIVSDAYAPAVTLDFYLQPFRGPARLEANAPRPVSWDGWGGGSSAPLLSPESLALYASRHTRLFFVDGVLSGDSAATKATAQEAQQWLDRHAYLLSQISTSAYYGRVTIRLYATQ